MVDRSLVRRLAALRAMDRWAEPVLVFLAAAAIPLLLVEVSEPGPSDILMVVAGSWFIWGGFAANLVARLALNPDRRRELTWHFPDLLLIVGQPLLTIGERKATPVLALIPLAAVCFRTILTGRLVRRTGHSLRTNPLRVIAIGVPFVWLFSAALIFRFERETGTVTSFGDGLWWGAVTLATVGYGDISPKSPEGRYVGVFTMVVGIGMFSVVTAQLAERLVAHRRTLGRSEVLESGHTLVLGWSAMVSTIVSELVLANRSRPGASIVILADLDTDTMYAYLDTHVGGLERSGTTVVCRTGDPTDPADLQRCRPEAARSVIVIDEHHDDNNVARCLLALGHQHSPAINVPIVAEITDPAIAAAIEHVVPGRVLVVSPSLFIARTAAQACLAPGVSITYEELLGMDGSELYVQSIPGLEGCTVAEASCRLADASLVGIRFASGVTSLCPSMDTLIGVDDQLVVVALDDSHITVVTSGADHRSPELGAAAPRRTGREAPLRAVMVGWNHLAPIVLNELDGFLAPGSTITLVVNTDTIDQPIEAPKLSNAEVMVRTGSGSAFADLVSTAASDAADHVIVLCQWEGMSASEADTRALLTTFQIRRMLQDHASDATVITELRDQHDVGLAPPDALGDFIVSDKLVSLLMTQLSEDRELHPVFRDLLDPRGAEIYCKPAAWYGVPDTEVDVPFGALVAAGVVRGDCVIGYRRRALSKNPEQSFGVMINPAKADLVRIGVADQVIVIADDAG